MTEVSHIGQAELDRLLERRIDEACRAGRCRVRSPSAFIRHSVDVAARAEHVARRLAQVVPPRDAPDPIAAFVAGAWHDAGKIWWGDDFHEIASAFELVSSGASWRLVAGPEASLRACLARAARAVLPHFALAEQWSDDYQPTDGQRSAIEPLFASVAREFQLDSGATAAALIPHSLDAAVLIFSDMTANAPFEVATTNLETVFDARWSAIADDATVHDPALAALLPTVRTRIESACARVAALLPQDIF